MVTSSNLRPLRREVDSITRPDPREHAEQILLWMICWPWSLVWTLLVHNPLRHIMQLVVVEVRATLEEISNGEFKEIERDLSVCEPLPATSAEPYAPTDYLTEPTGHTAEPSQPQAARSAAAPPTAAPSPAYVPPAAPAPCIEKDQWLERRSDPSNAAQGGDTAWLQDAWRDAP